MFGSLSLSISHRISIIPAKGHFRRKQLEDLLSILDMFDGVSSWCNEGRRPSLEPKTTQKPIHLDICFILAERGGMRYGTVSSCRMRYWLWLVAIA